MQQVNLYTDAFKPLRVKFPLEPIIAIPFIVFLILVGVSFCLSSYLTSQKEALSGLPTKNE